MHGQPKGKDIHYRFESCPDYNKKSEVKNNNLNSMATKVYTNGYIPKIEYWLSVSKEAIKEGNVIKSEYAIQKAEYFIGRQKEVYG